MLGTCTAVPDEKSEDVVSALRTNVNNPAICLPKFDLWILKRQFGCPHGYGCGCCRMALIVVMCGQHAFQLLGNYVAILGQTSGSGRGLCLGLVCQRVFKWEIAHRCVMEYFGTGVEHGRVCSR